MMTAWHSMALDAPPYRLTGIVYGTLLNHRSLFTQLGDAVNLAPYKGAPRAPVLFIKPRNTLAAAGDPVTVPAGSPDLEAAASLGIVIARDACKLTAATALAHVAGYAIVNDVSVPHTSYHRPSIRVKARDGFCPLGPAVVPAREVPNPDVLEMRTYVDGVLMQSTNTAQMIRSTRQLLADVTDFMTLYAGDVLCLGSAAPAPRVRPGQTVAIEIERVGRLSNPFIREDA
jgi:5-oxopent-3-ene-1,2,5-tricarboxylate decarboxylase/2-hydroxyhepta-2,4-diene-1,7-dioate isomerase